MLSAIDVESSLESASKNDIQNPSSVNGTFSSSPSSEDLNDALLRMRAERAAASLHPEILIPSL